MTVSVDAVVYYRVSNATVSVANVENAHHSTRLLAQTTLRNVLGTKNLSEILSERETISNSMQVRMRRTSRDVTRRHTSHDTKLCSAAVAVNSDAVWKEPHSNALMSGLVQQEVHKTFKVAFAKEEHCLPKFFEDLSCRILNTCVRIIFFNHDNFLKDIGAKFNRGNPDVCNTGHEKRNLQLLPRCLQFLMSIV